METTNAPVQRSRISPAQFAGFLVLTGGVILLTFVLGLHAYGTWYDEWSGYSASKRVSDGTCNVAVIPLVGDIVPYAGAYDDGSGAPATNPDDFVAKVKGAEADSNIRGILVRIDSGGGSPVASEIMSKALKSSTLPVAALIREVGASGAYLAATGAKTIFASSMSDVGSIGITMSYVNYAEKNAKDGAKYIVLSSAPFKDYLDPNKAPTDADNALAQRDLKILHEQFIQEVSENRNIPVAEVAKLADGSAMPGELALQNHLIDAIGDQQSTKEWFAKEWKAEVSDVQFCE